MPALRSKTPSPSKSIAPSILFHADASDPDMLYFSRFSAFDPYLAFTLGSKKIGLASAMEYGRMVRDSKFDEVLLLSDIQAGATQRFKIPKGKKPDNCQLVMHLAKLHKISEFRVGARFPAGLAFELRKAGMKISVASDGDLLPSRVIKTADEVEALRKGNLASAAGFRVVAKTLAESKVRRGQLIHQGRILTAERLRELISQAALGMGAVALHTIASPGDQACDCHNAGHGPIHEGELIVVDIFPRRTEDGYWGDMTRTFLKGKASDGQRRMVRTVKRAHELGMHLIKPGQTGGKVQEAVEAFFAKEGYKTTKNSITPEGFFHSLGHGIGLEVHESPFMGPGVKWKFKKGMVVTVEPGLYYRGIGGVRIEDTIHVTAGGNEKISSAPYKWEIP